MGGRVRHAVPRRISQAGLFRGASLDGCNAGPPRVRSWSHARTSCHRHATRPPTSCTRRGNLFSASSLHRVVRDSRVIAATSCSTSSRSPCSSALSATVTTCVL